MYYRRPMYLATASYSPTAAEQAALTVLEQNWQALPAKDHGFVQSILKKGKKNVKATHKAFGTGSRRCHSVPLLLEHHLLPHQQR
jgi:hypothetical protein